MFVRIGISVSLGCSFQALMVMTALSALITTLPGLPVWGAERQAKEVVTSRRCRRRAEVWGFPAGSDWRPARQMQQCFLKTHTQTYWITFTYSYWITFKIWPVYCSQWWFWMFGVRIYFKRNSVKFLKFKEHIRLIEVWITSLLIHVTRSDRITWVGGLWFTHLHFIRKEKTTSTFSLAKVPRTLSWSLNGPHFLFNLFFYCP